MNSDLKNQSVIPDLSENISRIKEICSETSDLLVNEVEISGIKTCLFCCE